MFVAHGEEARLRRLSGELVMPGLVPGIHVLFALKHRKTWMAGTSPAMTKKESFSGG
jgi:hypothetical protein